MYGRVCGARRLTWDSSELTVELQLLASGWDSMEGRVEREVTSSTGGGREGRGDGSGRGGGGGEGSERQGWNPLHFGPPFVRVAEELYSFRKSTLSNDFDLQRFFYKKEKRQIQRNL